jgi:hypothetical protein
VTFSAPAPLADHHELAEFNSGVPELDDWLGHRARANQAGGASRTFVVCESNRAVAYYALASGAVKQPEAPGRFPRNMPDPIPVAVLGRLAIAQTHQGRGIGRAGHWCTMWACVCSMPLKSSVSAVYWCMRFPMMREPFMGGWLPAFAVRAHDADGWAA